MTDLAHADLLDCQGRTTHRLVLQVDGTVTITFVATGRAARVDPAKRTNLTPMIAVPEDLMVAAATLSPW